VKRSLPVAVALLVAGGLAGAALAARTVTAPATVSAVAFDGVRVAFSAGFGGRDCDRVRLWNVSTRGVSRLGRGTPCVQTSTGTAVATVAVAGARALWLHHAGGNIREWTLWTASGSRPAPKRLRFVARDVDAPPPIVVGNGDTSRFGDLLPYAVDRSVIALRADGSRRFTWSAPRPVTALGARAGELAVASAGGLVTVLDARGRVLRTEQYAVDVSAVKITGSALLVQHGGSLELRNGGSTRTFAVGGTARLEDAIGNRAVYAKAGSVRLLNLSTGADRLLAKGTHAALEGSRVAVANGRVVTLLSR
jgi:hypothetical protein